MLAHPAGFEPATIRLEGGQVYALQAAKYKDFENSDSPCNTNVTLLDFQCVYLSSVD